MFISVPGDLDGDGVVDLYASDFGNRAKGPRPAARTRLRQNRRALLTLTGETPGEGFGIGPSTAGDVDGDGRPDLIVGAWQYAGAAVSAAARTSIPGRTESS